MLFYLAVAPSRGMTSEQQREYQRDAELFAAGICPVCLKQVGKTKRRHAMVQHFYRQRKVSLEHALYMQTTYKQHFRHGRSKKPLCLVQAKEVADMLLKHVDKSTLDEILQLKLQAI
jgi:hypothetical protein